MRAICLPLLLVTTVAGCGESAKPRPHRAAATAPTATATGPTAREYTARDRRARALRGTTLLSIPWIGRVRWRYDEHERFVTILDVPEGGATESVWMTIDGRLVKIGDLDPGDRAENDGVREGPVDIKVVQLTEPATVVAKVRVIYGGGQNSSASAPLVTARITTRDHSTP